MPLKRKSVQRDGSVSDGSEGVVRRVSYINSELPEGLDRAIQMFSTYPTMRVTGTAFENALRKSQRASVITEVSPSSRTSPSASPSLNVSMVMDSALLRESFVDESADLGTPGAAAAAASPSAWRRTESIVKLAAALKRAAMWQSIVVLALAQRQLEDQYRYAHLRVTLEKHLLPTLLQRREETGSVVARTRSEKAASAKAQADGDLTPSPSLLKEYSPFLASFNSNQLLQSFADKITRVRFAAGETVAKTDEPCQNALYILVSGKCEFRYLHDGSTASLAGSPTSTGPGATAAGGANPPRFSKEVLTTGSCFGGVFRTSATYTGTYKAISACVFWALTASNFESVFVPFADDVMKAAYIAALKEHCLKWIRYRYRFPDFISRTPMYRLINPQVKTQKYADDFVPQAFVRGETLFEQGDAPGDVFVLLEGSIRRSTKGPDGTYITGVSQIISPNDFTAFKMRGRFLLLGEECHVLPSTQRYLCRVYSRSAMFFRIPGERFVNALLDDPNLYVSLREKLSEQLRSEMRLDPVCLSFVPLLSQFPEECLQKIAEQTTPNVVFRSTPMCEPAQQLKEIFIVTNGTVRDARTYGHEPTPRLPTPPPADEDSSEDEPDRKKVVATSKEKNAEKAKKRNLKKREEQQRLQREQEEEHEKDFNFSFAAANGNSAAAGNGSMSPDASRALAAAANNNSSSTGNANASRGPIVYPDEQREFNPHLPFQLTKRFAFCLGGGWEGLLTDKWPHGWETTSTVEAWAVPTAAIRAAYNDLPKNTQSSILLQARQMQKADLGLPKIVVEKLPPMSSYFPEKVAHQVAPIDASASRSRPQRGVSGSTRVAESSFASEGGDSAAEGGHDIYSVNYSSGENSKFQGHSFSVSQKKPTKTTTTTAAAAGTVSKPSAPAPPTSTGKKRPQRAPQKAPAQKPKEVEKKPTAVVLPPASKPSAVATASSAKAAAAFRKGAGGSKPRPTASSASSAPEVTPQLLAVYTGEYKNDDPALDNIITDPELLSKHRRHVGGDSSAPPPSSSAAHVPPAAESWPRVSTTPKGWFSDVPTFEPLPGTIGNRNQYTVPPSFVPNSLYMSARGGEGYGKTLNGHADYFASAVAGGEQPLLASTGGGEVLVEEPRSARTPKDSPRNRIDLPKRKALPM